MYVARQPNVTPFFEGSARQGGHTYTRQKLIFLTLVPRLLCVVEANNHAQTRTEHLTSV